MSDKKLSVSICAKCGSVEEFEGCPKDTSYCQVEEVEVIPVSAPNVLSVDEAKLVAKLLVVEGLNAERETAAALVSRISDWAAEERG